MEGPRAARLEELPAVLALVNSIFPPPGQFTFRMELKYPLFLCEANLENIRVFSDQGRPVSVCSYYPERIQIPDCSIPAASIGAVCTEPAYRGQGLSTRLLDDVEGKASRESIDLLLISGTRGLYLRRSCAIVGGFVHYDISSNAGGLPFTVDEFSPTNLGAMADVYNREPARFDRSRKQFETLIQAGLTPDYNHTYRLYVTHKNGRLTSYIVLRTIHDQPPRGVVVEYAGDRTDILAALGQIACQNGLPFIQLRAHVTDPLCTLLDQPDSPDVQEGVVKILRPTAFMDALQPFFELSAPGHPQIQVSEVSSTGLFLQVGMERLSIEDPLLLPRLVFGFPEEARAQEEQFFSTLSPELKAIFRSAFPIPFPDARNLNYI